tara:strand:+ start:21177 stop:21731 length:555 start_codon:yes stop_codon:yes gene_type:complete
MILHVKTVPPNATTEMKDLPVSSESVAGNHVDNKTDAHHKGALSTVDKNADNDLVMGVIVVAVTVVRVNAAAAEDARGVVTLKPTPREPSPSCTTCSTHHRVNGPHERNVANNGQLCVENKSAQRALHCLPNAHVRSPSDPNRIHLLNAKTRVTRASSPASSDTISGRDSKKNSPAWTSTSPTG